MMSMRVRGSDDVFGVSRALGRLVAGLAMVMLVACAGDKPTEPLLTRSSMKLVLPNPEIIQRVEYTVTMSYLEGTPAVRTLRENYTSTLRNGELVKILPCTTGPDGDGLNQVDVEAKIFVRDVELPLEATGSGVFTCVRNADRPINIVLNVIQNLDSGFGDVDVMIGGTLCSTKQDTKDLGSIGVCGDALCDRGAEEIFIFANTCEAVQAPRPTFWACGDPADWEIRNVNLASEFDDPRLNPARAAVAHAWFPIPQHNGSWNFGVIALDVFKMGTTDPTLTAPDGTVKVWAGLSAAKALLERLNGVNVGRENVTFKYNFAAELAVAPLGEGLPAPELLLLVYQGQLGAHISWQQRFGPCEVPAAGVTLFPNLKVLDVRRDGNQAVSLIFADAAGFATSRARCETGWDDSASPRPIITCGTPSPLLP